MAKSKITYTAGDIKYNGAFPSDENPTALKRTALYGKTYARAIWASAENSSFSYSFDNQYEKIIRNRKFARGQHSVEEYKSRALPVQKEYITLDYSISTPLPKLMRITKDNILNHSYKPQVRPYDSFVNTKYEEEKNKLLGEMQLANEMRSMIAEGVVPEQMGLDPKISNAPKTADDVEVEMETKFQVLESVALEKLIKSTADEVNLPSIESKVVTDLVESYSLCMRASLDDSYQMQTEYIDILQMVSSYCLNDDFSDAVHIGHRKFITVGEFRNRMGNSITQEELWNVVNSNVGKRINQNSKFSWPNYRYFDRLSNADKRALESVMIEVFDFEVVISEKNVYKKKGLSTGGYDYNKKSSEYKGTSPDVEIDQGYINKLYRGEWVVGFDYMLSWGLGTNVIRKIRNGKYSSKPCFSYVVRKPEMLEMSNVSMCQEAIPHIEQMIIYQIKLQHFVAIAKPSGFSYNTAALTAALPGMGIDELTPVDMADITVSLGDSYYSSISEDGQQILDPNPVRPNPTTLGDGIGILVDLYNNELFKVKDILGLNNTVDSSDPNARVTETATQMAYEAHRAAIKSLQDAYLGAMDDICERIAYGHQMAIQAGKETEQVKELLNDPELAMLKLPKVGELLFNIKISMLPDTMQRKSMMQKIDFAIQQGTLEVEDGLMLENSLEEVGGLEKTELLLRKMKKDKARREQEKRQAESEALMAAKQQEIELATQLEQLKAELDVQKETTKKDLELRNQIEIEEEKRKTLILEYDKKEELLKAQSALDVKRTENDSPERTTPLMPKTDINTDIKM